MQRRNCQVDELQYEVRQPTKFKEGDLWPVLLFLHGAGERGSNVDSVHRHGPWKAPGAAGFLIVAPLCPSGAVWPALTEQVHAVVVKVCNDYPADPGRLYLTGLSLGAFGCWSLVTAYPCCYKAVVAVCGGYARPEKTHLQRLLHSARCAPVVAPDTVADLRSIPAWLFHGSADKVVDVNGSQALYEFLGGKSRGQKLKLTIYSGRGHSVWSQAYNDAGLYAWLWEQGSGASCSSFRSHEVGSVHNRKVSSPSRNKKVSGYFSAKEDGFRSATQRIQKRLAEGCAVPIDLVSHEAICSGDEITDCPGASKEHKAVGSGCGGMKVIWASHFTCELPDDDFERCQDAAVMSDDCAIGQEEPKVHKVTSSCSQHDLHFTEELEELFGDEDALMDDAPMSSHLGAELIQEESLNRFVQRGHALSQNLDVEAVPHQCETEQRSVRSSLLKRRRVAEENPSSSASTERRQEKQRSQEPVFPVKRLQQASKFPFKLRGCQNRSDPDPVVNQGELAVSSHDEAEDLCKLKKETDQFPVGKGGARRTQKVCKDNFQGVSGTDIRDAARQGGRAKICGMMYEEAHEPRESKRRRRIATPQGRDLNDESGKLEQDDDVTLISHRTLPSSE